MQNLRTSVVSLCVVDADRASNPSVLPRKLLEKYFISSLNNRHNKYPKEFGISILTEHLKQSYVATRLKVQTPFLFTLGTCNSTTFVCSKYCTL
jgi:hypothetical protein